MKSSTKISLAVAIVLALAVGIYFSNRNKTNITSDVVTETATTTTETTLNNQTVDTVVPTNAKAPQVVAQAPKPASTDMKQYKGEFFPFEFSYPPSFKLAANLKASTKELESKSYWFNRLALDGGVGGYLTFYVNKGDNTRYDDMVSQYPDKYSKVTLNGNTFYKHVEKVENSNKGYVVEYITYKGDVQYRFSLTVSNGDKKDLDIKAYQSDINMIEQIANSLKIS
jgi:hypothetical protein